MSSLTKTQESIQNCWSPKQHTSGFRISDPQEHRRWFTISDPQTTQEIQNFWSPKQQRRGFRIFFFGSGGEGGGGAWLLINVGFLKPVILCSKALLVLRSRLELGIVSHKVFFFFYQRSSFALLTTMRSEMHQWQSFYIMQRPVPSFSQ